MDPSTDSGAVVRMPAGSEPVPGSATASANMVSPVTMPGNHRACCAGVASAVTSGRHRVTWTLAPPNETAALAISSASTVRKPNEVRPAPPNRTGASSPKTPSSPSR